MSSGIQGEIVCRGKALRDLEARVQAVCAGLQEKIDQKADRKEVVRALWLKVDK